MKNILSTFLVLCLMSFSSCKNEKKEKGLTQMENVMAIHDDVMPKMSEVGKLVGQLKPMADSLGMNSPQGKAMKDLQDANKAMMDWMQEFGGKFDSDEIIGGQELTPEKKQLLNAEEVKIKEVKDAINSSIANAEVILQKKGS